MNEATIREVFSDEVFVKGLFALETPVEVQQALHKKDISLTIEEIVKVRELLLKRMETGEELSEEELESVNGGAVVTCVLLIAALFAGALIGGAAVGAGIIGGAYIVNDKTSGGW
jgi:hypothetical protein